MNRGIWQAKSEFAKAAMANPCWSPPGFRRAPVEDYSPPYNGSSEILLRRAHGLIFSEGGQGLC